MSSSYKNEGKYAGVSYIIKQNSEIEKKNQHKMKSKLFQMNFHRCLLNKLWSEMCC